ncbi:MAG: metal ABC transporter substrate-binding protein [Clostridia bacterium]|nr:metal ABC transporter substrate-binding protein [Clostridia bacterium]
MKKFLAILLSLVLVLSLTAACADELKVIRIGASPAPHAEVLESEIVTTKLAELGYKLDVIVYEGYSLQNPAVSDGTDDANYFQHHQYLASYNATAAEADKLATAFSVHYEPFGIYSESLKSLDELKDGAIIALPNDPSNETRAMLLLAAEGLITLPEGANAESSITKYDITKEMNPRGFQFDEQDASLLPTTMTDCDISVINGNYAIDAGLSPADALALEAADSEGVKTVYGNIVAIRQADVDADWVKALETVLCSEEVRAFMTETYKGGVVPTF